MYFLSSSLEAAWKKNTHMRRTTKAWLQRKAWLCNWMDSTRGKIAWWYFIIRDLHELYYMFHRWFFTFKSALSFFYDKSLHVLGVRSGSVLHYFSPMQVIGSPSVTLGQQYTNSGSTFQAGCLLCQIVAYDFFQGIYCDSIGDIHNTVCFSKKTSVGHAKIREFP